MVTRTGLASFQALTAPDEAPRAPLRGSTEPGDAAPRLSTELNVAARAQVVTAVAEYFKAVGRLAAQLVAFGDIALAQDVIVQAGRVAASTNTFTTGSSSIVLPAERPSAGGGAWEGI